ncbi:MAG: dynamin family protein [Moorea sp. SIOASIH]|uniref:dynamin family protein n=1 Tax=Moorena sp. SIOASIH TaxID=2607817 RepID=UPI0013BB2A7F|nr:dynamin family protein [Moorena sp. SIOASIH]NEO35891.1 dynamin family protein [Moorena sp. SIOASIH]
MVTLPVQQEHLFNRSLNTIKGVKLLFVEAELLFDVSCPDLDALKQQLENPFSIFVCGEFNAGKSSVLNRLSNDELAAVGILPTTNSIQPYYPEGFDGIVFIDSPGTNSIIERHQELTENYLQHADIILFVTSVERPLTKSELDFLSLVSKIWVRKVIVIINKVDLITPQESEQIISHVKDGLRDVFTEVPPLFTVSTRTGKNIDTLRDFLLEFLVEAEKIRLKLQGPQNSLLVYLEQLEKKNHDARAKVIAEKTIFDRSLLRIDERIEQYDLIFGVFREKIRDLFTNLIQQLHKVIQDNFAFISLLKKRIIREDDLLEEKVARAIKEVKLEQQMEDIVKEAASTLLKYREQIIREAREDLQVAATLSEDSFQVPEVNSDKIDTTAISENLKVASEKGLNNFLTLGTAAAATGIGGHVVATAALFDLSAFVLALMLTMFSFNAVPKQRDKATQQLDETLRELQNNYTDKLKQGLQQELVNSLKQFTDSLKPRLGEIEHKLAASQSLEDNLQSLRQEINDILKEVEQL